MRCGFSSLQIADIRLAVGEAATNAVEHGHVPGSTIDVEWWFEANELWISIEDHGGGLATSEKTWMRAVDKVGEGGFGMLLMNRLMDDVRLAKIPGDGAKLIMRKRRTDEDAHQ